MYNVRRRVRLCIKALAPARATTLRISNDRIYNPRKSISLIYIYGMCVCAALRIYALKSLLNVLVCVRMSRMCAKTNKTVFRIGFF